MNIFWLSLHPEQNAALYNDQHCVKIILEITQVLFAALHTHGAPNWQDHLDKIYKATHLCHPVTLWTLESPQNFLTVLFFGITLCAEFTRRRHKTHACERLLVQMLRVAPTTPRPVTWKKACVRATAFKNCTPVPLCMDPAFHVYMDGKPDLVASYRNYYVRTKMRFTSGRMSTYKQGVPVLFADAYNEEAVSNTT